MYTYERILAEQTNSDSDRLLPYEDPTPENGGDLEQYVGKLPIQKCIFIAPEARIAETREQIAERLGDGKRTTLTVAIAGMLEVSTPPYIASGVLCHESPSHTLMHSGTQGYDVHLQLLLVC